MGACVSVHKDPDSTMKFRLSFGSKTDNLVIPSPVKNKPLVNVNYPIAEGGLKSQRSTSQVQQPTAARDFGSKEDAFFDSQPWLDSDCDDDFFSVNGDFTPSRGSTPVHHNFSAGLPRIDKAHFDDKTPGSVPQPSLKKSLSELFQENSRNKEVGEQDIIGNQNGVNGKTEAKNGLPPRSANSTPFASGSNSVCSTERTPNIRDYMMEKEEPMESMRCCLPRVLSSRNFSGRKTMSPARSMG